MLIARDLKGADYEKKLIWRTEEGMAVNPFYRAEDLKNLECPDHSSCELPQRRWRAGEGRLPDSRSD